MSEVEKKGGRVKSRLGIVLAEHQLKVGKRITLASLATAISTRPSTLSRWMSPEPMEKIDANTLEKLCNFFECQVGDLIFIDRSN